MPKRPGLLNQAVTVLAVAYPISLVVVALAFVLVGESWWATAVGLYLPRLGFVLPMPVLLLLIALFRRWRLLWTQLAALVLVLFPLMGLVLPWPKSTDAKHIRVMSWNVNSLFGGLDQISAEIQQRSPDILMVQEIWLGSKEFEEALKTRFRFVHASTQFVLATNYPILEVTDPERLPYHERLRSPRFMRYLLDTPLGPVAVYNVHPVSPRHGLGQVRSGGLRNGILSGRLFMGAPAAEVMEDTHLRALQVEHFATMASAEHVPVILGGDTNLPGLSHVLHRYLASFRDGFAQGGKGFGYTFPDKMPWMRIDRIMSNDRLEFTQFEVGCQKASDHRCVWAEVQLAR